MFNKVVVANRGAVAARVLRALNEMGIRSVAVYSEADAGAPYLELASETYAIGPAPARESYLNQDALLEVLRKSRADGLHPGYGFLSENAGVRAAGDRTPARASSGRRRAGSTRWGTRRGRASWRRSYGMPMSQGLGRAAGGPGRDPRRGARDRLPGAGEAGRRRRRDRHAAGKGRSASCSPRSSARARWPTAASAMPRSISSA